MVPQAPQVLAHGPPSLVRDREYMAATPTDGWDESTIAQNTLASTGRTAPTLGPYVERFVRGRVASPARQLLRQRPRHLRQPAVAVPDL